MASSDTTLLRFIRNPLVRAARFPFLLSCVGSALNSFFLGPLGMLFLISGLLTLLAWWLIGITKFGSDLFHRRWRAGAGRALLLAASVPLVVIGIVSVDYVHLIALYPYYLYRIEQTTERPVKFAWGDAAVTVLDGIDLRILLYDDSGTTQAMVGIHRQDPKDGLWIDTRHLMGNFFLEEVYTR